MVEIMLTTSTDFPLPSELSKLNSAQLALIALEIHSEADPFSAAEAQAILVSRRKKDQENREGRDPSKVWTSEYPVGRSGISEGPLLRLLEDYPLRTPPVKSREPPKEGESAGRQRPAPQPQDSPRKKIRIKVSSSREERAPIAIGSSLQLDLEGEDNDPSHYAPRRRIPLPVPTPSSSSDASLFHLFGFDAPVLTLNWDWRIADRDHQYLQYVLDLFNDTWILPVPPRPSPTHQSYLHLRPLASAFPIVPNFPYLPHSSCSFERSKIYSKVSINSRATNSARIKYRCQLEALSYIRPEWTDFRHLDYLLQSNSHSHREQDFMHYLTLLADVRRKSVSLATQQDRHLCTIAGFKATSIWDQVLKRITNSASWGNWPSKEQQQAKDTVERCSREGWKGREGILDKAGWSSRGSRR